MITSIVSYQDRGSYGKSSYRGNCSGRLIKDLLQMYNPKQFIEIFAGSGTGFQVCQELGIKNSIHLDLNPVWGGWNALTDPIPSGSDFIFSHAPYWDIIKYSNSEWGNEAHPDDLSQVASYEEFIEKLNRVNLKIYQSLVNGGRHAFLMGDVRKKGKYYSIIKDMMYIGDLESHVIKVQHNTVSGRKAYPKTFIPIEHEHLLIFRKNQIWKVPIQLVKTFERNLKDAETMTWRDLIQASLEELGQKASLNQIYDIIKDTKKAQRNTHWKEKVRQTLQVNNNFYSVSRGIWALRFENVAA